MSSLSERKGRDIARKLAERERFEPPAGLLEKIKSEIPPEVTVGTAFNAKRSVVPRQRWLIASSLVAAVGAGLVGLRTWEARQDGGLGKQALRQVAASQSPAPQSPAAPKPVPPARFSALQRLSPVPPPPPPPAMAQVPGEETAGAPETQEAAEPEPKLRKDVDSLNERRLAQQVAPAKPQAMPENLPAPSAAPPPRVEREVEGGVVGGVAGGAPAGAPSKTRAQDADEMAVTEESPLLDARKQPAKAEKPRSGVAFNRQPAGADPFVDAAAYRLSTFGLDVDTASYAAARRDLLAGHLPDPASVRVEEWVNAFDYGDPEPPRGDLAIRAEGAPSPFAHGPERRLLRLNVKARQAKAGEPDGTLAARNAGVQVEFNTGVVARYRLLGYEGQGLPDARLRAKGEEVGAGQGVTALYEIELRPHTLRWEQPVATLRLYYREAGTGHAAQMFLRVGFQDFAPTWEQAPRRLRLASLVAELAEILKGAPWTLGDDVSLVARRIQEVAPLFPGNPRVAELVDLAARAARLKAGQRQPEE